MSYRRDRRDRAAIAGIAVGAFLLGFIMGLLFYYFQFGINL